jgi:signal transduction histidine kinase/DNA-binding response OmpR family regulator
MKREQILSILYEMAIVIGGETSLNPLLTKTLQRLMYHTSFPVGMIFSGIKEDVKSDKIRAHLEIAIGDFELARLSGSDVDVPVSLVLGDTTLEKNPSLLNGLPCRKDYYTSFLRMPVNEFGTILLLAPVVPESGLPVTRVFRPIISNFSKAILLCQRNEAYTAELIDQRNIAAQANLAKSTFLANMSHELRTPMLAVLGFAKLMTHDPATTESQREYLTIINRAGEHLLGLINDVLDMSKIEAGRITLEPEAVNLRELIGDISAMMKQRCDSLGLTLSSKVVPTLPAYIVADRSKLRQVFINLLGNAVKYTKDGGISLQVSGEVREEKLWLICEVTDTGIGIAPDDQERIFEPFVQVGKSGDMKGTGLGLAITRQYVELMGGRLWVQSELEKGSTFHFEIPVGLAASMENRPPALELPGTVIGLAPDQPLFRLLVADDIEDTRLLLRRILEPIGFQIREVANGEQAIEVFKEWHPHFIWMDCRMPVLDGLSATRKIRTLEGGHKVVIVALTASVFKEQRDQMLTSGCDDFLRKPFREEEIFEMLARHLGIRYIHEQKPGFVNEVVAMVRPNQALFRGISPELRAQLRRAALECNAEQVANVIAEVRLTDETAASGLATLAKTYRYPEILQLIEEKAPPEEPAKT